MGLTFLVFVQVVRQKSTCLHCLRDWQQSGLYFSRLFHWLQLRLNSLCTLQAQSRLVVHLSCCLLYTSVAELRGLSQEELAKKENELKKELFDLRFQAAAGQLDQTARLNEVKKQIARVKTVQSEIK